MNLYSDPINRQPTFCHTLIFQFVSGCVEQIKFYDSHDDEVGLFNDPIKWPDVADTAKTTICNKKNFSAFYHRFISHIFNQNLLKPHP